MGGALELLRAHRLLPGQPDFRGFEWRFLYRLCQNSRGEVLATSTSGFSSVDYSPDGHTVAFGSGDGWVDIFDLGRRQRVTRWQAHGGVIDDVAFYPQNPHWLATTSGDDGLLKLWDVTRQQVLFSLKGSKGIGFWASLTFSPSGRFLVAGASEAQSLNL
jgi:WD40 repeat protein